MNGEGFELIIVGLLFVEMVDIGEKIVVWLNRNVNSCDSYSFFVELEEVDWLENDVSFEVFEDCNF